MKELFEKLDIQSLLRRLNKGAVLIGLGAFAFVYLLGVLYFQSHFVPNTRVGARSIAFSTKQKALETLQTDLDAYEVELVEGEQSIGVLPYNQLAGDIQLDEALTQLLEQQSPELWLFHLLFKPAGIPEAERNILLNEGKVSDLYHQLDLGGSSRTATESAKLVLAEGKGYVIQPEVYGKQLSVETLDTALKGAFLYKNKQLDLVTAYVQPKYTSSSQELLDRLAKVDGIQNTQITLTFDGHSITIPKDRIASWLILDESGNPTLDEELIVEYLGELNRQYASIYQPRQFQSTYMGVVTVQPGTLGWYINSRDEAALIKADLEAQQNVTREPSIGGYGYGMEDDIGKNYVEVDLINQWMWVYSEGVVVLETPIVSGRVGAETVPGAYQVWEKKADTALVGINPFSGEDYEQPVDYWIAFDDNAQGIHDANWQPVFGGDAHYGSGSLGCINTPPALMGQVFEWVYYGMPVIIH